MRLKTPTTNIGKISIGSGNPIAIQTMTNTDTADAKATAQQCIALADAGAEIVRFTVNNEQAAEAVPEIRKILDEKGYEHLPLIGDFHFNGHELLPKFPECAKTLDKYRINPGNIGKDENFETVIKIAIENNKTVRIGGNWGCLDQKLLTELMEENSKKETPLTENEILVKTLVKSMLDSARLAEKLGLPQNKIVLSVKTSEVQETIKATELLVKEMKDHLYAIHLGLTEAGSGIQGMISSSAALGILLQKGIGDTIRISLTPNPKSQSPQDINKARAQEVLACKELLQSMGFRCFRPKVTSCPGCGRTSSSFFQELAKTVNQHIDENLKQWIEKYPGIENLKIAVMGCIVNGPGEASHADIAICIPGKNEQNSAVVYQKGEFLKTLKGDNVSEEFIEILEKYISE